MGARPTLCISLVACCFIQFLDAGRSGGSGNLVAAAGQSGCAALWDFRCGSRPSSVLAAAPRSGALHSLHLAKDGLTLCCGTEGGELIAWDLRGGIGASKVQKFGCDGAYVHPLLFSCPLGPHLQCLAGNGYKASDIVCFPVRFRLRFPTGTIDFSTH